MLLSSSRNAARHPAATIINRAKIAHNLRKPSCSRTNSPPLELLRHSSLFSSKSSFSTSSTTSAVTTTTDKDTTKSTTASSVATTNKPKTNDLVAIASMKARQILTNNKNNFTKQATLPNIPKIENNVTPDSYNREATLLAEKEAINAADALLALTSSPAFVQAVASSRANSQEEEDDNDDRPHEDLATLHTAFLSVTNWCCSVSLASSPFPSLNNDNIQILNQRLMELTQRSEQLKLPLHLPLYNRIAESLSATTLTPDVADRLLDLYSTMKQSFDSSSSSNGENKNENGVYPIGIGPAFYHTPLCNLVHQNKIRDAIDFIKGMMKADDDDDANTNNISVDYKTTVMVLSIMEERAIEDAKHNRQTTNEADAMELALLLHESIVAQNKQDVKKYTEVMKELGDEDENFPARLLELILSAASAQSSLEEEDSEDDFSDDEDEDDYYSDDESDDEGEDEIAKITMETLRRGKRKNENPILPTSPKSTDASLSTSSSLPTIIEVKKDESSSPSSIPEIKIMSGEEFENYSLMNQVYIRDNTAKATSSATSSSSLLSNLAFSQQFDLPDVSSQFVRLNGGKEIRFTDEYEQALLRQIMDESDEW